MPLDTTAVGTIVDAMWERDVLPALHDYIRIPNVSPEYAPDWADAGHMGRAVELVRDWCAARHLDGATVEVHELAGRTPLVLVDVPAAGAGAAAGTGTGTGAAGSRGRGGSGESDDDDGDGTGTGTVLLYGHLDKQPPMDGWLDGLDPWEPVQRDGRLYGRGSADDGYAAFSALTAIEAVRAAGGRHRRAVVLIEASEESGSPDLPAHVDALADRLGSPSLVVCLDSGMATWDRLWTTTSLRGLVQARLEVALLREGVHSGLAGGIVPSTFRVLRQLLDRIEDSATGRILLDAFHVNVPEERGRQLTETAEAVPGLVSDFPWLEGCEPSDPDRLALLRANTWEPSLAVTGLGGAPPPETAGNVLRAATSAALSLRLPPTCDPKGAAAALEEALTRAPPERARVTLEILAAERGWDAPITAPWLAEAVERASMATFGRPSASYGMGGTIPFMAMLGERFPEAQFLITGVLGPGANAHGPNEFLDVPTAKRVTAAVAHVLDAHASAPGPSRRGGAGQ
ncbi:MAG: M20/M25/M40 family metallo-hydrolase [Actinobacteria bacterium]|nr:M20/M25/M40 family metallo-hydrolase [Actinomycetota bacterium]